MTGRKNSSIITHELLLHDAASLGDERKLDDLNIFIKRGKFDIDFKDEDWGGRTALHCASEQGDDYKLTMSITLAKRGKFNINFQDEDFDGRTALHCAAATGHLRCCKYLLEGGADSSARMSMGWTPAHCAAEGGHLPVLQLLSQNGGVVNARDDYGDTPKLIAKRYGHLECVEYLESLEVLPEQRKAMLKDKFQFAVRKNMKGTSDMKEEEDE